MTEQLFEYGFLGIAVFALASAIVVLYRRNEERFNEIKEENKDLRNKYEAVLVELGRLKGFKEIQDVLTEIRSGITDLLEKE